MSLSCQKDLFEIPPGVTYLNAAYLSPIPRSVGAAGARGIDRKLRPWEIAPKDFFVEPPILRSAVGRLLGAGAEAIAIAPSTSYGTAIAARNLDLENGAEVVLLEDQYPSNYYIWRDKAVAAGGRVVAVGRPGGSGSWSDAVYEAIGDATGIVALPQVHWADGTLFDLEPIAARCREVGAALVLDLTQSLGVLPFSVADVDPDFVVVAAYKWLLGPYSLGFLYAAPRHHGGTPIEQSWLIREGREDFSQLASYRDDLLPDARRFDVGESTNFALVPMAIEALRLLEYWGIEAVRDRIESLGTALRDLAAERGISCRPRRHSAPHIIGLELPDGVSHDRAARLAEKRIYVSVRARTLRVSPHVYNEIPDIERLVDALASG